jgi:hypothetical protein
MSLYFDNKDAFLEPTVTQHGSHMVMTNVSKSTKKKYINIDTRFRDEFINNQVANYTIILPQRVNEVKNINITNIEIPNSIYNISSNNGNHSFHIEYVDTSLNEVTSYRTVLLDNGNYESTTSVRDNIHSQIITDFDSRLSFTLSNGYYKLSVPESVSQLYNLNVNFNVDGSGNYDRSNLSSKLGWLLGFRKASYVLKGGDVITAEALPDLNGARYLYLAIDEFGKGNQHSFVSPLSNSFINKNIIARIAMDNTTYGFGKIHHVNRENGTLISDKRNYSGKIDLQKLNIQLLNEYGNPVNLNGLDFSFCMELEHE